MRTAVATFVVVRHRDFAVGLLLRSATSEPAELRNRCLPFRLLSLQYIESEICTSESRILFCRTLLNVRTVAVSIHRSRGCGWKAPGPRVEAPLFGAVTLGNVHMVFQNPRMRVTGRSR